MSEPPEPLRGSTWVLDCVECGKEFSHYEPPSNVGKDYRPFPDLCRECSNNQWERNRKETK